MGQCFDQKDTLLLHYDIKLIYCNLNYVVITAPPLVLTGDEQTRRGYCSLSEGCRVADTDSR